MERYNEEIAENKRISFILVSGDSTEEGAKDWAEKEKFPWPTVLKDDQEKAGVLSSDYGVKVVPTYLLVDRDGKEVGRGKTACFDKVKELAD